MDTLTDKPTMFVPEAIDAACERTRKMYETLRDQHQADEPRRLFYDFSSKIAPGITRWALENNHVGVEALSNAMPHGLAMAALMIATNLWEPEKAIDGARWMLAEAITKAEAMQKRHEQIGVTVGQEIKGSA